MHAVALFVACALGDLPVFGRLYDAPLVSPFYLGDSGRP